MPLQVIGRNHNEDNKANKQISSSRNITRQITQTGKRTIQVRSRSSANEHWREPSVGTYSNP